MERTSQKLNGPSPTLHKKLIRSLSSDVRRGMGSGLWTPGFATQLPYPGPVEELGALNRKAIFSKCPISIFIPVCYVLIQRFRSAIAKEPYQDMHT